MAGFIMGNIADITSAGCLKGIQREIACDCWFTSSGRTIPKTVKVMNDEGILYTIRDVQVLYSEDKTYSGIKTVEHVCKIKIENIEYVVKLVFTKEDCKWIMVEV